MNNFYKLVKLLLGLLVLVLIIGSLVSGDFLSSVILAFNFSLYINFVWCRIIAEDRHRIRIGWCIRFLGAVAMVVTISRAPQVQSPQNPLLTGGVGPSKSVQQTINDKPKVERFSDILHNLEVDSENPGIKLSLNVKIKHRLSRKDLPRIIDYVLNDYKKDYERVFISFYLDGSSSELGGPWVNVHYERDGKIETYVSIYLENEKEWRSMPPVPCKKLIGQWLDGFLAGSSRISIVSKNGSFMLIRDTPEFPLSNSRLKKIGHNTFLVPDEYITYKIDVNGNLQKYDTDTDNLLFTYRKFDNCFSIGK